MTQIRVEWRGAFAASASTIAATTIKRNNRDLKRSLAELRGHDITQEVRLYVETVYKNKLVSWKSETKEEKLPNKHA